MGLAAHVIVMAVSHGEGKLNLVRVGRRAPARGPLVRLRQRLSSDLIGRKRAKRESLLPHLALRRADAVKARWEIGVNRLGELKATEIIRASG